MAIYAIGDIHGQLSTLIRLINKLDIKSEDHIIFLGDYIDRGPDSMGVIKYITELKSKCNVTTLIGNHELLMMDSLELIETAVNKKPMPKNKTSHLSIWLNNGGDKTIQELDHIDIFEQKIVGEFFNDLIAEASVELNGVEYTLCHSMPTNTVSSNCRPDLLLYQSTWARTIGINKNKEPIYDANIDLNKLRDNYAGKIIVHGHTPVMNGKLPIKSDYSAEVITWQSMNIKFINIDIGCAGLKFDKNGNRINPFNLCALRLDDQQDFYAY
jgi:predicted MPP superfamily phosphohydrolase